MPEDRRHAAIMFTDIVGYTAIMGSDEDRAFEMLLKNREIHHQFIEKFKGSLIKEMGDGILISFNLASDAVRYAIEIQKKCKTKNIPLKIGIHEGEMVFAGADVLGDGVNIASRLQESAEDGCILISGKVYSEVKNRTDIHTTFIEEKTLKNVDEPIKVYNVNYEDQSTGTKQHINLHNDKAKKKSIVVLPFTDISPNQDNEYFSDGLTEEIISDLSQIDDIRVISRTSANLYKGSNKSVSEIARELNVQFVLEGSVRKAGNNLRITAQLIDAIKDTHLWAEKYNGTLEDVFDIQEKVSRSIVDALHLKISPKVNEKIAEHPIDNVKAFELHHRARYEMMLVLEDALNRAIKLIKNGINLIGENEILYYDLGLAYLFHYEIVSKDDKRYMDMAENCVQKIIALNPDSSFGHSLKGNIYIRRGDIKNGVIAFRKALEISPNEQVSLFRLGWIFTLAGKGTQAKLLFNKLLDIDPLTPVNHMVYGALQQLEGGFKSGLEYFTKAYELEPDIPVLRYWLAVALAYVHRYEEAYKLFDLIEGETSTSIFAKLGQFMKYALQGEKDKALMIVTDDFKTLAKEDEMYPVWMAESYSIIGENNEAIDWIEHGIDFGFLHYEWLSMHDPFLKNIREDLRFKKLLERVRNESENFGI